MHVRLGQWLHESYTFLSAEDFTIFTENKNRDYSRNMLIYSPRSRTR